MFPNNWREWLDFCGLLVGLGGGGLCVLAGILVEFTPLRARIHWRFGRIGMGCVYIAIVLRVLSAAL